MVGKKKTLPTLQKNGVVQSRVGNVLLLPTFSLNGGQEKDLAHPTKKRSRTK
ncbi:hypothetical protein QUF54_02435 [Candidatus Marithioploca araucensis]|uniref:Uncharacterized protein n=1 Tax=Candidatus Marithioploca araucensis TaxID=70273 RepID=A0ABT7VR96_9GAMM|nr:hypothetical protein [Candidatus Marithioploca araucensis]